ncbi:MAG: YhcH/YjgK/YiaL family protein [Bacteroidales bacterium]|nr:YhcH/YjgK/YiaL family protein [Candidatus Physcousia equi]
MILDKLQNLERYAALNPLFKDVARYIQENDLNAMSTGRHNILGDELYVNIQSAAAKTREQAKLESHKLMIDIQVPLSAGEEHGWRSLAECTPAPYNEDDDISFHEDHPATYFSAEPGDMVIFFPEDGHAPAISANGLRKAIFKVKA